MPHATFFRLLEAEDKSAALLDALHQPHSPAARLRFLVDPNSFASVPRSPFAYWVSEQLRRRFRELPPFESDGRAATVGASTKNDAQYTRQWWEVASAMVGRNRNETALLRWVSFTKGGSFSRFYADVSAVVDWHCDGYQLKTDISEYRGSRGWGYQWSAALNGHSHYFRAGLTWPLRGMTFSAQAVPAGCIFSVAGKMAFVPDDNPTSWLALFNSQIFDRFIAFFAGKVGGVQYEAGLIANVPVPHICVSDDRFLHEDSRRAWSLKRSLDTRNETSHAFTLPAVLQGTGETLDARCAAWARRVQIVEAELAAIQAEIDERCFDLYGIDESDRRAIREGFSSASASSSVTDAATDEEDSDETDTDDEAATDSTADAASLVAELLSWTVGVTFGRFDIRLATGERKIPVEPEPFDPLPVCSPGMLTGDDGLPITESRMGTLARPCLSSDGSGKSAQPTDIFAAIPWNGLLVDDPGHPLDIEARVQQVLDVLWPERREAREHEACELLGVKTLRESFGKSPLFFADHLKRYSKSRRQAPIYWPLASANGGYTIWCYYHRFRRDTLSLALGDFAKPKLRHEQKQLDDLRAEAGPQPTRSQREEIEAQETLVSELSGFVEELARVAPLWNPDLNDGVIINYAPLWRMIGHTPWRKAVKECWDTLCAGDYDWAHLAMHLWPERVVPKCQSDASLAIAHGLDEVFWEKDNRDRLVKKSPPSGGWQPVIDQLVTARTSSAVKAALDSLLNAPSLIGAGRGRRGSRSDTSPRRTRASSSEVTTNDVTPTRSRTRTAAPITDTETLAAIKNAIASHPEGMSKSDALTTTGLSEARWIAAIKTLLEQGTITKTGERRATRYHLAEGGHDA